MSWRPPSSIRKAALRSVLTAKLKCDELIILDELVMTEIRTKTFRGYMSDLNLEKALVITAEPDENVELSSRNLPMFKVLRVAGLNCYDLLKYDRLVIVRSSLPLIGKRLSRGADAAAAESVATETAESVATETASQTVPESAPETASQADPS
jgi:large subunit ribosomal protein L4